jgi:hypothetical protein
MLAYARGRMEVAVCFLTHIKMPIIAFHGDTAVRPFPPDPFYPFCIGGAGV